MSDAEQLKKTRDILRDLAEDWRVNMNIINEAARKDTAMLTSIRRLCRETNKGNMVKMGLTLVAFPLPIVVDDVLGWTLVAGGLIQRKIKNSALYVGEVDGIFTNLLRELHATTEEVARLKR